MSLQLYIRDAGDPKQAANLLENAPRLTSLTVRLAKLYDQVPSCCSVSYFVVKTILPAKVAERTPLQLEALRFEGVCFRYVCQRLQGSVDLATLEYLQLVDCKSYDHLLQMMSQHCLNLRSFAMEDCYGECYGGICAPAINRFLQSISAKRLVVRAPRAGFHYAGGQTAFNLRALLPYAPTMECPVIDDKTQTRPMFYGEGRSLTNFVVLCKLLQNLQQLCIASPTIEGPNEDFPRFLVRIRLNHLCILRKGMPSANQLCRIA